MVRELPKRNFVDLVGQPSPIEEDFEEPMDVAHVDDFMVAVHEESPISQKHFTDLKALYEWGEWESGSFTQCGVQNVQHRHQNRWGGFFLCLAHTSRNRWFSWICHQQDENSVRIL